MRYTLSSLIVCAGMISCSFDEQRNPKSPSGGNQNVEVGASAFSFLQKSLFAPKCESCHGAGKTSAGVNLTGYDGVFAKRQEIVDAVVSGRMPPRGSVDSELQESLKCWVALGAGSDLKAADIQKRPCAAQTKVSSTPKPSPSPTSSASPLPSKSPDASNPPQKMNFAMISQMVFQKYCKSCHIDEQQADIDLRTYQSTLSKTADIVRPKKPDESVLMRVLIPDEKGIADMPKGGVPLSQDMRDMIKNWILEGAVE